MQNRYVGDVGDFANNGLLRWLCGKPELDDDHPDSVARKLRLGVVWCMNNQDSNDYYGGTIGYLSKNLYNDSRFSVCDPSLYLHLKSLVFADNRDILAFQKRRILPANTLFFGKELPHARGARVTSATARKLRKSWLEKAHKRMQRARVVFVNPDIGIDFSVKSTSNAKYVTVNELKVLSKGDKCLIIYNSFGRNKRQHNEQIALWVTRLKAQFKSHRILTLRFGTISPRAHIIVMPCSLQTIMEDRLNCFVNSSWREHFTLHGEDGQPYTPFQCKP